MTKRIIDKRKKEKFMVDDQYLNGMAKLCGWQGTIVYNSLCRHANIKQESFPSIQLMCEQHNVSKPTIHKGIDSLVARRVIEVKKTRTKSGQWLNNVYILLDKSEWDYSQVNVVDMASQVNVDSIPSKRGLLDVVNVVDTKETHSEGNTYKETHTSKTLVLHGNQWNLLIDGFKVVNPLFSGFYSNTTERKALEYLASKIGYEKLIATIKALPEITSLPYAPKITKPTELKRDFGKLLVFYKQNQNKINKYGGQKIY